jgi:16S rRNA (guanine527-N7)-methyltransferase
MDHQQLVASILAGAETLGQPLSREQADRQARLLEELSRWSARMNLTAIRELPEMVAGHVLDSLAVRPFLSGERILDIGTGAGFPGLPLAIVEPQRRFWLLDSNARKIAFIQHVVGQLGLDNVVAVQSRAESYVAEQGFATVIARAVATIPQLIDWAGHLVDEAGIMLALKGRFPHEELAGVPQGWSYTVDPLDVPGLEQRERHVVILKRRTE